MGITTIIRVQAHVIISPSPKNALQGWNEIYWSVKLQRIQYFVPPSPPPPPKKSSTTNNVPGMEISGSQFGRGNQIY